MFELFVVIAFFILLLKLFICFSLLFLFFWWGYLINKGGIEKVIADNYCIYTLNIYYETIIIGLRYVYMKNRVAIKTIV